MPWPGSCAGELSQFAFGANGQPQRAHKIAKKGFELRVVQVFVVYAFFAVVSILHDKVIVFRSDSESKKSRFAPRRKRR